MPTQDVMLSQSPVDDVTDVGLRVCLQSFLRESNDECLTLEQNCRIMDEAAH